MFVWQLTPLHPPTYSGFAGRERQPHRLSKRKRLSGAVPGDVTRTSSISAIFCAYKTFRESYPHESSQIPKQQTIFSDSKDAGKGESRWLCIVLSPTVSIFIKVSLNLKSTNYPGPNDISNENTSGA